MNVAIAELAKSILNKDDLSSSAVDDLRQLASRYPYFLPARLLYLKKLQQENDGQLEEEMRRAELWVPNTAWLDQLLFDTGSVTVQQQEAVHVADAQTPEPDAQPVYTHTTVRDLPADGSAVDEYGNEVELLQSARNETIESKTDPDADQLLQLTGEEGRMDPGSTEPDTSFTAGAEPAFDPLTGLSSTNTEEGNSFDEMNRYTSEVPVSHGGDTDGEVTTDTDGEVTTETDVEVKTYTEGDVTTDTTDVYTDENTEVEIIPAPEDKEPVSGETDAVIADSGAVFAESGAVTAESVAVTDESIAETDESAAETNINSGDSSHASAEFKIAPYREEPMREGQELSFEPFHTVDYFASQGIQAKDEEKPVDRFSQQLKSFTQWLKAMKKVPGTPAGAGAIPEEKKIEEMAEHSLTGKDVVTEAMAEVWIKQGNTEKARAVYQKLSLLDPAKSAYFAAKIEQLKFL